MQVTNMPQISAGMSSATDLKSALIEMGIAIAQTVITNYIHKKVDEASKNIATNIRKRSNKAFVHPRRQYRARRRYNFRPYRLQRRGRRSRY